ncbi:MAG: sigma-70 family RNA polymerase sigma factor [Candidatus Poribacteria bacterium]|nr:sigma-70 family RNA polymerase sigma factor [Candidatus Poribacteria bacterium]
MVGSKNYTAPVWSTHGLSLTDERELVERFQNGEQEVFNELVIKYQGKVYNLVYKYVSNPETARDLSQEVFIKAFQALPHFKRQSAFYSWLYRIAINLCIDFIRQQNRKQTLSIEDLPTGGNDENAFNDVKPLPPDQAETRELGQIIGQAVRQLPPGQQRVFNLRYQEGLQLKEIAARLDRSEGTIKAHLHHAHRRLQTLLLPYLKNEKLEWAFNP